MIHSLNSTGISLYLLTLIFNGTVNIEFAHSSLSIFLEYIHNTQYLWVFKKTLSITVTVIVYLVGFHSVMIVKLFVMIFSDSAKVLDQT